MPWKETEAMEERTRFAVALESELYTMTELCERFGVSRTTGYKWRKRFFSNGFEGLREQSRVPHTSPLKTPREMEDALVELRQKRPTWGAKKLLQRLRNLNPEWDLPSRSAIRPHHSETPSVSVSPSWKALRRHDLSQ